MAEAVGSEAFDHLFKILVIGDSGVGKSCLLVRFTSGKFEELSPTVGVDFRTKFVEYHGNRVKLTIWDTAGQERFRTLTSSYYRGAQGIIYVYDVTRAETFDSVSDLWMKEVDLYSTVEGAVQMIVANKVDKESEREVSTRDGMALARRHGCLFVETSAKANIAVGQAFEELVLKILDTPSLLSTTTTAGRLTMNQAQAQSTSSCC